jgi:hypothetical protein
MWGEAQRGCRTFHICERPILGLLHLPHQACSPRSLPPLFWALSEAPLFAAWSGKSHPGP